MSDDGTAAEGDGTTGDAFDPGRLGELVDQVGESVVDLERAVLDEEGGGDVVELAQDLWGVLEELEELLATLDFEELPEAIDFEELPDAVDLEDVPEGLVDEDESAIDLGDVMKAVNLREVWDAVDLTEFLQEKRELEAAVDDVADGGEGEDDGVFENVVDADGVDAELGAAARQAFIEEKTLAAVEKFRSALLSTHDGLRKAYEKNQEKLGSPGNQPDSLNPTAASTMPGGPIPNSASTRASTVPPQVRYSRVDNPRRIFGERFEERRNGADAVTDDAAADEAEADAATDAETEGGQADATTDGAADADDETETETETEQADDKGSSDDVPEIEVHENDD